MIARAVSPMLTPSAADHAGAVARQPDDRDHLHRHHVAGLRRRVCRALFCGAVASARLAGEVGFEARVRHVGEAERGDELAEDVVGRLVAVLDDRGAWA